MPEAVDVLVVSAFSDDHTPTQGSLIGSLDGIGVSIAELARKKKLDLRPALSCWLSPELTPGHPGVGFRNVLCFEPRGEPPEVVADIFQSLAAMLFVGQSELSVAMPLVASGDMGWPASAMLKPLLQAAVAWIERGLPLASLKIVERDPDKAAELGRLFEAFVADRKKAQVGAPPGAGPPGRTGEYDAAISYAHVDAAHAEYLAAELRAAKPSLRLFVDRPSIAVGALWLEAIFDAIEASRKVVALLSPGYLGSRYCRQEFLATMNRENKRNESVLFPLYLLEIPYIPAPYDLFQLHDCLEADHQKMQVAARKLLAALAA